MFQVVETYCCPKCGSSNVELTDDDEDDLICECGGVFATYEADVIEATTNTKREVGA